MKVKVLLFIFIFFVENIITAQTIELDTLLRARADTFIIQTISRKFPSYQINNGKYIWGDFSVEIDKKHWSAKIKIKPSNIFLLNGSFLDDSLDIDFCQSIDDAIYLPNFFSIVPDGDEYKLIYKYRLRNLSWASLIFRTSKKEIENPIVDFSSNYNFYKGAKLSEVEIYSLIYPPNIEEYEVETINKISRIDSIRKVGNKRMALKMYKDIARKYKKPTSPYTNVDHEISELSSELKQYEDKINALESSIKNDFLQQGDGRFLTEICKTYLFWGKDKKLKKTLDRVLSSKYSDKQHKLLSSLYFHISQIMKNKNETIFKNHILEAVATFNLKYPEVVFQDLCMWLEATNMKEEKRKYIRNLIDEMIK